MGRLCNRERIWTWETAPAGVSILAGAGFCHVRWEDCVTLKGLLALLIQRPEFRRLITHLQEAAGVPVLTGITEAARPYVIAALAKALQKPMLIVAVDEAEASRLIDTLKVLLEQPGEAFFLPDRDALPYERLLSARAHPAGYSSSGTGVIPLRPEARRGG